MIRRKSYIVGCGALLGVILLSFPPFPVFGEDRIPVGFEEFFEEREILLDIELAVDRAKKKSVSALVSGDSVRIINKNQSELSKELSESFGIEDKTAGDISASLISGVVSSKTALALGTSVDCYQNYLILFMFPKSKLC